MIRADLKIHKCEGCLEPAPLHALTPRKKKKEEERTPKPAWTRIVRNRARLVIYISHTPSPSVSALRRTHTHTTTCSNLRPDGDVHECCYMLITSLAGGGGRRRRRRGRRMCTAYSQGQLRLSVGNLSYELRARLCFSF